MKSVVITFPGSNCDRDAIDAVKKINSKLINIWYKETKIDDDVDLIIIPGGFSYGDYLRSGAMASISPIMKEVARLAKKGVKVLGICNGFQILTEAQLLDGVLIRNKNTKFINRDVKLKVCNNETSFTSQYKKDQVITLPVAHMDGYYFAKDDVLQKLTQNNNIAFKYCSDDGETKDISNINGSCMNIAGIFNDQKNILGMMPHPERAIDKETGLDEGLIIFESIKSLLK